ncbi:hypothetical protein [Flavobacterium sp. FPG59]|uniref:hypothetical protein n=1 Tax=Flavobacterium sp. FPG59 TaxID=1929267 RepID=UPI0011210D6C|nr:hypothetical protein [Flavobacterium sp. FPG59]
MKNQKCLITSSVAYAIRNLIIISNLLLSFTAHAQLPNNELHGHYIAQTDSTMYSFFEFDGNGKASIMGMGNGDYFVKGDTLYVFPDKSIFKFKIKGDTLTGVSNWVTNGVWVKNDSIVEKQRKDKIIAQKNASLLHDYYILTKNGNPLEALLDSVKGDYTKNITSLCDQGLSRACMDYFGLQLSQDTSIMGAILKGDKINPNAITLNPELIKLGEKIIALGEYEGHTLLGYYYFITGNNSKAKDEWEKGSEKGSMKATLSLMQLIDDQEEKED